MRTPVPVDSAEPSDRHDARSPGPRGTSQRSLTGADPYLVPANPLRDRVRRAVWIAACAVLFRPSPRPLFAWRAAILRMFGARIGAHSRIYPGVRIFAPWHLECEDVVAIADGAILYNPSRMRLGSHAIVSQEAYLCGATHDCDDPAFPLIARDITIGAYAWICARATVLPGVTVEEGAVLGLGSVATGTLSAWAVHAGVPARKLRNRAGRDLPR